MNEKIKDIAKETLKKVPLRTDKFDEWLDDYLIAYSRSIIFTCSDVVRDSAKDQEADKKLLLKSTAVDVLDYFGL
jgi:hypothetical protein